MQPIVSIDHLTKRFGSFVALKALSLEVLPGEIFALLGPNGAGKTTAIRMLIGVLQPSSGGATIRGLDCFSQRAEVMRHVGYLPDEPQFYDYLRGSEILRFVTRMHGFDVDAVQDRVAALAERLELDEALDEFAVNYSKGMKKKLALMCAMLHEPELLILDEPTNGLDPFATRTLHEIVRETAANGTAVFYSTHLLEQAEKLCQRVAILNRGELAACDRIDALRDRLAPGGSLEDVFFEVAKEAEE